MLPTELKLIEVQQELRVRDIDLGAFLEFAKPVAIRKLITEHIEELRDFGVVSVAEITTGAKGGRPGTEYRLTREQASYICTVSGTAKARKLSVEIVKVFNAYARGELGTPKLHQGFLDRIQDAPKVSGYFTVFRESADLAIELAKAGIAYSPTMVPDGSIGTCWGNVWRKNELAKIYGERIPHPYKFPSKYPQAFAAVEVWCYPDAALPAFRRWMDLEYVPIKLQAYLLNKEQSRAIPEGTAARMLPEAANQASPSLAKVSYVRLLNPLPIQLKAG